MNRDRLTRFRAHNANVGLDGAVIRRPANVFYLTGYPARLDSPSFAIVGPERLVLVAPGEAGAVQRGLDPSWSVQGYGVPGSTLGRVPDVHAGSALALENAVAEAGLAGKHIGVEQSDVSARHAAVVATLGPIAPLDECLAAQRRIKDASEIDLIQAAVTGNDVGFAAAAKAIAAGMTEFAVQNTVVDAIQDATGVPIDVQDPTNAFLSGPRTLLAAAPATPRRLERGDLMILDLNPYVRHYKGDTTRTFCVGAPTPVQQAVHDALVRGLEAAEKVARPGISGRDLFAVLVRPIVDAGFGTLRLHGGHALGLEHTERPFIIPGEEMQLEEGMVIALEPGVYLPGVGGLRVEDNYRVTADGLEVLSHFPRELTARG